MPAKPNITTSHTRKAFLQIEEKEMQRLLAQAVAAKAGIDLDGQGVTSKVIISSRNTSTGSEKYAEVTITEDLSLKPRPTKK